MSESNNLTRRAALSAAGATGIGILLPGMVHAQQEPTKAEKGLTALMDAKSETVPLAKPGKTTRLNVRLAVTIEDENEKAKKVFDGLFNQDGQLVKVVTADAHLAKLMTGDQIDKCYKRCKHHLDDGNAPKYAVCFYACVAEPG